MEVYDQAHVLARKLRESAEFQCLLRSRKDLEQQPEKLKRVRELKEREFELQARMLSGEKVAPERLEAVKQMAEILLLDPVVRKYLEAEGRFARLFGDVQKIIADAVKEWEPLVVPGPGQEEARGEEKDE